MAGGSLLALGLILLAVGCSAPGGGVLGQSPTDAATITLVDDRSPGPADYAGPTERNLRAGQRRQGRPALDGGAGDTRAMQAYDAADRLYRAGKFKEAEAAFKDLVSARRKTYETFRTRWERWWGLSDAGSYDPYSHYGDPLEEDALFMLAESQFRQGRYSWAQDSYDDLLDRYPSTRHMEEATRRLFKIAMYWLEFTPSIAEDGEVQLASHDSVDPEKPPPPPAGPQIPIIPNLADRTKPVFDTHGRALQALRSIWLHDATGPLADDALMLSANHHLRTGDFVESARLYKLLREQYPDSPHFQDAHLLGAHVTLASYEGAPYDGKSLAEARELKQSALAMFPDMTPEERERLQREIDRMYTADIARQWDRVEYYRIKQQPQSVALYCQLIINRYPDSQYAERARQLLAQQRAMASRRPGLGFNLWPFGGNDAPEKGRAARKQGRGPGPNDDERSNSAGTATVDLAEEPAEGVVPAGRRVEH